MTVSFLFGTFYNAAPKRTSEVLTTRMPIDARYHLSVTVQTNRSETGPPKPTLLGPTLSQAQCPRRHVILVYVWFLYRRIIPLAV